MTLQECLELQSEVADFLQQRVGGPGSAAAAEQPPAVLAVDATGDADDLERLKGALLEVKTIETFVTSLSAGSDDDYCFAAAAEPLPTVLAVRMSGDADVVATMTVYT